MAIDEVLLDRAASEGRPRIRLYAWDTATLSLGYFQRVSQRWSHPPSSACPLVRRPSGGGAIVHDEEITYSLAIPGGQRVDSAAIYQRVQQAFLTMFKRLGIKAAIVESSRPERGAVLPLLCFQRRTMGDVVVEGHKVVGSAQRRRRGALLEHGSVLLHASRAAPELPGISDLTPAALGYNEWVVQVRQALLTAFDWSAATVPLADEENELAELLVGTKYGTAAWNEQR